MPVKNEILTKLRNVLAKLYPDEVSMRRISHDAGLDLTRISFNSSAINNWHSILIEAENVGRVDALLTVVLQEYGRNQTLLDAYQAYQQTASQPIQNDDQRPTLNTGGGAAVGNNVQTGGDFVGRDQINFFVALGNWEEVQRLLFKGQGRAAAVKALQTEFQSFDWTKAEDAYLDKVVKLYDRVRILGNSTDVPLGDLFTQVYILDKPAARYRHDIEELRKRGAERDEFQRQPGKRIHGLDLVKIGENLFILGKPGAGKTTFLKYIAIQAARKQLPRIPIFVSFNHWADSKWGKGDKAALLPFLVEQFDICNFPDAALFLDDVLRTGRALVLFDGLDEVKQEKDQRRRLTHLLQDFARKYDKSQHLITCRIAASDYAFAGFADVEVADFTKDQVHEYARKWFGQEEKKFDAFTSELANSENRGLAELCNTPLLLSLLCLTFDNNLRFPPSRAELYEDALETLLRKWDSNRSIQRDEIYRALSHKRKLQLLMNIAVPTFTKGELFFRQRDLEKWIVEYLAKLPGAPAADTLDGTTLLKAIEAQHSILVERAQGIYSFSHLTFQEYLTARYLAENQGKAETNAVVRRHLTDQRWREVFLLTASLLDDAEAFVIVLRQATDLIIASEPFLIRLLAWAQERTQVANAPVERLVAVQLVYIFLESALSLDLSLARSHALSLSMSNTLEISIESALSLSITHAHALDLDLAHANALALALDLARARANALEIALALDLARSLARATAPLTGFDYGLYYAWSYAMLFANDRLDRTRQNLQAAMQAMPALMAVVAALAEEGGLAALAQQLLALPLPPATAGGQAWQCYADALFVILREERDLGHDWEFTDEASRTLNDYFYANELLVQCLKVAAVSDREVVLQGLLLPPDVEAGQEDKKIG